MKTYFIKDDYGNMIDTMLNVNSVKKAFYIKGSKRWIDSIDDAFLRNGLEHLNDNQIMIIEEIVFKDKCIIDVSNKLGYRPGKILNEIHKMREILMKYI